MAESHLGLSIEYYIRDAEGTLDQGQINRSLIAGLKDLGAQVDDLRRRIRDLERDV